MTEAGLLGAGDPCAADGWSSEGRVKALAWWHARHRGVAWSLAPVAAPDVWRIIGRLTDAWPGMRNFVMSGLVAMGRRR